MGKLSLVVALVTVAAQARADENKVAAKHHYEEGMKRYNLGDFAAAKTEFKAAYLAVPDPSFLFNLGQCARRLGEPEEELNYYRAYLRAQPDTPKRAEIEGFIGDAEAELKRRAAERPPTAIEAPKQLGAAPAPVETPAQRRWWIWAVVGGGVAVAAGVVALVLALVLPNNAPDPSTSAGVATVRFP